MADEEKAVPPEEKKKKSPVIMIVVLVLVGLVLAGGISYFVTTKMMANTASSGEQKHHDPGVFVKLGDAKEGMIINVGGVKSGRFLKLGMAVEMNPERKANVVDNKLVPAAETKIMDTILQTFRTLKLEDLDASKQDALKAKLKDELNKVLGDGSVYDVYITSFVLQ
mgnify:CR=1 FL=1